MKNYVTDFDLTAAFKALDEIDYDKPEGGLTANRNILNESITDRKGRQTTQSRTLNVERLVEDYYDLEDNQDLNQAAEDRDGDIAQAKLARIEKIVDLDAKTADDLLPSYVGKVIIQCPQCMNLFYKNEEDLVKDEEDPTTCNVNEPCQHCGNISGYTVIGKVDKLDANDQAELGGAAPADDLDLNLDTEATPEEAPAEETPAETTEAPAEGDEGSEGDLDLDLDLNLEEPAQESLNRSKAAKSDFASVNTSKLTTLNEEVDPDLDKKLAAHDSYINYLRSEIESLEAAVKNEKNDEIKTAKEAHLAELQQALDEALPEAVKNAPVAEETAVEETEVETEATPEAAPEADGTNTVGVEDLPTDDVQESLKEDKRDDDDYYGKDIDDALIQLKKRGHAEFWCRQGKNKAEEVKKAAKEKYNLDVEYTIDDDYCEAKVIKSKKESIKESLDTDLLNELVDKIPMDIRMDLNVETNPLYGEGQGVIGDILFDFDFNEDTIDKATELANAVISNLDQAKYSYQIWNPNALSTEECQSIDEVVRAATDQNEVDLFDEDGYLQISIYENESAVDESLNKSKAQKDAEEKSDLATGIKSEHKSLQEGSAAQMLAAFEASLDDDGPVDESVNKAEINANTVPENASENKSINECDGKACQECDGAACEAKPEDELDEAVAITIGVEEVEDTVTPTADTMIIAEPETDTAAVYTPDSTEPQISIAAQPIEVEENPFGQEFDAEYNDEPEVDPFDQDFDDYEEESEDDDEDDDNDDKSGSDETEDIEADDEEAKDEDDDEDDDKKDESLKESLQEGIWDKMKAIGKGIASTAKNLAVGKGGILDSYFKGGYVVKPYSNGQVTQPKTFNKYDDAEKYAVGYSTQPNISQVLIDSNDVFGNGNTMHVNGFIGGKQAVQGKQLFDKAVAAAQGGAKIDAAASAQKDIENSEQKAAQKQLDKERKQQEKQKKKEQKQQQANQADLAGVENGQAQSAQQADLDLANDGTPADGVPANGAVDATANAGNPAAGDASAAGSANGSAGVSGGAPVDAPVDATAAKKRNDAAVKAKARYQKIINALAAAGLDIAALTVNGKATDKLKTLAKDLAEDLTNTNESLTEDIANAAEDALAGIDAINKESEKIMADAVAGNTDVTEDETNEGLASAVGDVVNGVADGVKDLLADNADDAKDAKDAKGFETIDDKYQSTGFGDETPDTEADKTEVAENLQEDVSDAEYDQMLNSDVFQDFNEEINPDELEDIDEESVNECTTNYLKEVYSNVDKFELTQGDVKNGVLVLEGVIKFHSGAERTTTFGYNLNGGLNLKGVNEDLAKGGEFVMSCTLENKKLIAESLSYKYEVNGQLIEGLIRR